MFKILGAKISSKNSFFSIATLRVSECMLWTSVRLLMFSANEVSTLRQPGCNFARPMLRFCATHFATLRDSCCDFAQPILRLSATLDIARLMLRICVTQIATLRNPCYDFARLKLRICATYFYLCSDVSRPIGFVMDLDNPVLVLHSCNMLEKTPYLTNRKRNKAIQNARRDKIIEPKKPHLR